MPIDAFFVVFAYKGDDLEMSLCKHVIHYRPIYILSLRKAPHCHMTTDFHTF